MTEMRIGDQTIRYSRQETAAVYATLKHGDTERCGCISCQNFALQRNVAYPDSFRSLLDELGIDPNKEGEVFEYGPIADGYHLYGGWFNLIGELVVAGERNCLTPDLPQFEFFFTAKCPDAPAFGGGTRLAIEFTTRVKWVLPSEPG